MYTNEFNQTAYTHGVIDFHPPSPNPLNLTDTFPTVVGYLSSFTVLNNGIPNNWGVQFSLTPNSTPLTNTIYRPYSIPNSFTISKGIYGPEELAALVTEKMSINYGGSKKSLVQSPYLWGSESFSVGYDQPDSSRNPDGTPQQITEPVLFIEPAMNQALIFKAGVRQWSGSSQIALEFDSSTAQRFNFVFTHFPNYDSTGKNICVKYCRPNNDLTQVIKGISHYGGIFFNSLTATDSTGAFYDFWEAKLGFLVGAMVTNIEMFGQPLNTRFGKQGTFYTYTLVPGLTHTIGYFGLDSAVVKEVGTDGNWWIEPSFDTGTTALYSTINSTIPISATLTLPELLNKFSHYILQCDLYFTQMIGTQSYRNFQGTVSKFYSFGSYTYGDQTGAFEYIHSGQPIYINSVRLRVLKSDKTLDEDLGPDNTAYFQIIKGTPSLVKTVN
jgi:hypothetical protein